MNRALVVVEPTDSGRELLKHAGEIAAGTDTELVLVHVIDEDEYEGGLQRKAQTSMSDIDSVEEVTEKAESVARKLGEELLPAGVTYTAEGLFGDLPDDLLNRADELECNHVFITGDRRSPAGKALFGDTTQAVLLNFDGPVTSLIG